VFVLLPGGTFTMGSQAMDPNAPFFDPDHEDDEVLHQVTLAPFFLARHELTRAQWRRLAGEQITGWKQGVRYGDRTPIGPTHPADSMDWDTADLWLRRHGMELPTEAQWEYGARAGTTTVWWPGPHAEDLQGCANVHDRTSFEKLPQLGEPAPITDGFRTIAPVATFRANAFGLHDVHGNVSEWCGDWDSDQGNEGSGDGVRPPVFRSNRGGSYGDRAVHSRSSNRSIASPSIRDYYLGLRPARALRH